MVATAQAISNAILMESAETQGVRQGPIMYTMGLLDVRE